MVCNHKTLTCSARSFPAARWLVVLLLTVLPASQWCIGANPDNAAAALRQWRQQLRSREPLEACIARSRLAAYHRAEKELDRALRLTETFHDLTSVNIAFPRSLVYVEGARCLAARGDLAMALKMLTYASDRAAGVSGILALEAFGDCFGAAKQPKAAVEHYDKALKVGQERFPPLEETAEKKVEPERREWERVVVRINRNKRELERLMAIDNFGLDYVLYKEAQELRAQGKLEAARQVYTQLADLGQGNMFGQAADFYRGLCFQGEDAVAEKLRYYAKFYKNDPGGLYRGEALFECAQACLTEMWNREQARGFYQRTLEWCRDMIENKRVLAGCVVPEKCRDQIAPPPAVWELFDDVIILRVKIPPEKVVNRITADWYLSDLLQRARYGLVFCFMADGKWSDARALLDQILHDDPYLTKVHGANFVNTYWRLKKSCDWEHLLSEPPELRGVPEDLRVRIQYADFVYLSRKWPEAEQLYLRALQYAEEKRNRRACAVAMVSYAELAYLNSDDLRKAEKILREALARFPREPACARGAFYLANLLRRLPPEGDEKEWDEQILELYRKVTQLMPGSKLSINALGFSLSVQLKWKKISEARQTANKLLAAVDDPKGWEPFLIRTFRQGGYEYTTTPVVLDPAP